MSADISESTLSAREGFHRRPFLGAWVDLKIPKGFFLSGLLETVCQAPWGATILCILRNPEIENKAFWEPLNKRRKWAVIPVEVTVLIPLFFRLPKSPTWHICGFLVALGQQTMPLSISNGWRAPWYSEQHLVERAQRHTLQLACVWGWNRKATVEERTSWAEAAFKHASSCCSQTAS